jgi:hypothetical protein
MLITRIKASNFYGVKDPIEVKFTEGGDKEKVGYTNIAKGKRVSLISGFYGANASGKSTILNLIDTITRVMVSKLQEPPLGLNVIESEYFISIPNYSEGMQSKPIEMEMDFIIEGTKYNYSISIINEGKEIFEEVLTKNDKNIFTRKNQSISLGAKVGSKIDYWKEEWRAPKQVSFLSIILDDSSDISVFTNLKEDFGISNLKQIKTNFCFITDKRSVEKGQNHLSGLFFFAINYLNNPSTQIKDADLYRVNSIVKYFEPSFKSLNIQGKGTEVTEYSAQYENFYKKLPVTELSAGTREIISYINDILKIIKTGGVIVYDETSKYYHPDMEIAILSLFKDKSINKNNAQIFFSSHNHETFDLLQNNQAHILEKNNETITISKVSDYDVQERDNVKRIYRLGSLGGVPDTIDFNRIINNIL